MGDGRFLGVDLEEIQESIVITPEEAKLMEDKLMGISVSKPEQTMTKKTEKIMPETNWLRQSGKRFLIIQYIF